MVHPVLVQVINIKRVMTMFLVSFVSEREYSKKKTNKILSFSDYGRSR